MNVNLKIGVYVSGFRESFNHYREIEVDENYEFDEVACLFADIIIVFHNKIGLSWERIRGDEYILKWILLKKDRKIKMEPYNIVEEVKHVVKKSINYINSLPEFVLLVSSTTETSLEKMKKVIKEYIIKSYKKEEKEYE